MKWSVEEIDYCVELVKSGLTYNEISEVTNRTTKAIRVKMNRLGIRYTDYIEPVIKYCINCGEKITNHGEKFCSHSCSAIFNNKLRKKPNKCLNCGCEIEKRNKFCSHKCEYKYKKKQLNEKIESGDTTLDTRHYKRYLIEKHGEKCMKCGWSERNPVTGKVPIELDHINGNSENNSLENLRLLCPNCHSLTPTYKGLNAGNGRHKRMVRYYSGKSY